MNSINSRLNEIESILKTTPSIDDNNDLVARMKKKEEDKKKLNIDNAEAVYRSYVFDNMNDDQISEENFIQILILTIKYVKENNHNISRVFKISPSDEFENEACCYFIKKIYDQEKYFLFSHEMLSASVFELKKIIYKETPLLNEGTIKEKKKKKFF